MKRKLPLILLFVPLLLSAQKELLRSGPMPGYSEMKEAAIWLQTKNSATVFAKYWPVEQPGDFHFTNTIKTTKDRAFTAVLVADTLEPGNRYKYVLYINNAPVELPYETFFHTQTLWLWRTDPPEFSFLMGSGAYINEPAYDRPGKPYGDGYQIFNSMAGKQVDFMLWLGDNVYLRQQEWNTKTGLVHRYTHDRSIPELQKLLASTHHYAILDDHDFGPNDSDRSFWNKNQSLDAFEYFWANPSYGVGNIEGAITSFQYGDAAFFLLDNRTHRSPDRRQSGKKTQLGEEQLQWLFNNLASTYARFKFVVIGGQLLSTSKKYESYSNYGFDQERQRIIDFIREENILNVIFLTGDVHFSEVSVLREEGRPTIWDITSSPLTSGANTNGINQENTLRIPESVIMERNFTQLSLSGPRSNRVLTVRYFDSNGKELWKYRIEPEIRESGTH
ncbi:MAG: alkaline phosphatase family protein [Bacteroidales bacterium]|nr:alkaline phosphatase family protein [Bacteroidales bacterium]